jgi:N-acetylneuraminate synthase/N,N'-diacetyllegionaminate synthase
MEIQISGKRFVGEDHPCYIIMDVAANHNGDLETAKKLIEVSAKMGADAVKFQTYTAEKLYSRRTPLFSSSDIKPYELIKRYQHPREWLPILNKVAKNNIIDFASSPFDFEAVDLLEEENVPFYKVASPEIVDLELIEYMARTGKPIIISTGMSYMGDIEDAIQTVLDTDNKKIIILHCNTLYPTPIEAVNLKAIKTLKKSFKFPIGFSDHTLGIHVSLAAVAMGAKVIERHITLDKKQEGPDHQFALDPLEVKSLVKGIRDIEKAIGNGIKRPHQLELEENFEKGRRSIIAARNIPKGTLILREMLIVKRPGFGIKPKFINLVLGRKAKKNIEAEQWITWDMI